LGKNAKIIIEKVIWVTACALFLIASFQGRSAFAEFEIMRGNLIKMLKRFIACKAA
jgi:hypothetical protein